MPIRPPTHKPPGHRSKKHKARQYWNDRKGSVTEKMRRSPLFLRKRKSFLVRHPLCVECLKRDEVTAATVLDHVIPHKGDAKLFWDEDNWQSLCKPDHSRKTNEYDGGFGNEIKSLPDDSK